MHAGSGNVLIVGGFYYEGVTGFQFPKTLPTAELYHPATGTFSATGSMQFAREEHTASVLASGKVLIAGGRYVEQIFLMRAYYNYPENEELYDPEAGTFAATGSMAYERRNHTASVLGSGKVLIAGGSTGHSGSATAELYDPEAGTFTATGLMTRARMSHTASVLASGKVLIAGSGTRTTDLYYVVDETAELYDPADSTFSATGSMAQGRAYHSASVLGSGKVLIAGGHASNYQALATAELYDPAAGTFTATGSMAFPRSALTAQVVAAHTASVLRSGKVLIAGGDPLTAELYDPELGTFTATAAMAFWRAAHTASVLESGKVLVAGGGPLTAELYDEEAPDPQPEADAGAASGGSSGAAGSAGAPNGGTAGSAGAPNGGTSANTGAPGGGSSANADADDGCACRAASGTPSNGLPGLALAALIGFLRRRARLAPDAGAKPSLDRPVTRSHRSKAHFQQRLDVSGIGG